MTRSGLRCIASFALCALAPTSCTSAPPGLDAGANDAATTGDGSTTTDLGVPAEDGGSPLDSGPRRDSGAVPDTGPPTFDGGEPPDTGTMPAPDAGSLSRGCGVATAATGDLHLTAMDGAGHTRDYEVLVPASYSASVPLALTFVYHGAGGTEAAARGFGLQNAPGASAASIFVFPQGITFQTYGVGWDDGCGGYDMPFFDTMLAAVEARYCVDRNRVFVAGFSWGGDQTTALLCCRGDRIRAAAPSSCTDEYRNPADATTYNDLPCPTVNHAAIRFTHAANGDGAYPSPLFATTSALFQSFNRCANTSSAVTPTPCVSFASCAASYIECPYAGLGHTLPSGWGTDTWAFFAGFH